MWLNIQAFKTSRNWRYLIKRPSGQQGVKEFQINYVCAWCHPVLQGTHHFCPCYVVYAHTSFSILFSKWLCRTMSYLCVILIWCSECIFLILHFPFCALHFTYYSSSQQMHTVALVSQYCFITR